MDGVRAAAHRVAATQEHEWFDQQLRDRHYLGPGQPVGDYLRQVVERGGQAVALLVWGPACYALKDRDQWIGWSATTRVECLSLIVQNRRFLLLTPKGGEPNLASQVLGLVLRELADQWHTQFGYTPLLAETFTNPESFEGTCYKASNWTAAGTTAGYSRHRADFYVANDSPKKLWLRELMSGARRCLREADLPEVHRAGLRAAPSGTMPLLAVQRGSLLELLRTVPDPRGANTRYRIAPVLTLVAMALMAGRREIAEIARFATTLSQAQRRELCLPRKVGTKAFWTVPGYSVFYQVLTRLDPAAFAEKLSGWLAAQVGSLPAALAMDGKMIRDQVGLLTLADHEDGTPFTVVVIDQKEGPSRSEQPSATQAIINGPALDEKVVTADALHCQKDTARAIVERGGDYLLQLKGNQPKMHAYAQACEGPLAPPFFLPTPNPAKDASTSGS
ncbi:MAG: ISAs1 family transposase [Opitutus sp.]|nr:ISAs1 family transposase [Opitutus sp.]MCS6248499.1 ISAs1 family transposase [Opitutus sp.]MCS6275275.1 ISAs1 family transposase [Opitutus sp.]MCS6278370.1 ISAs1 family transposase [Opitutus sp.]MCS6299480.1 ISAs1 family transposase [Opitutus sp.]